MRRVVMVLVVLAVAVLARPASAEDNPFLGTWKLNVAKSKYEGAAAPKSQTRIVTQQGME